MATVCSVSELAMISGIKKQVLRRYDRIGLLGNRHRGATEPRVYSREDLVRLERLVFMQMIGVSRRQIEEMLTDDRRDISRDLRVQSQLLVEKRKRIDRLIYFLQLAEEVNRQQESNDWHHLGKAIEAIRFAGDREPLKHQYMRERRAVKEKYQSIDGKAALGESIGARLEINQSTRMVMPR